MNEISRCCRLLGVQHGATFEDVKTAYRDLVQVWHPDRFAGNERLQASAQEKLKQLNLAWEHLSAHAFRDGILVEPEDVASLAAENAAKGSGFPATSQSGPRVTKWPWLVLPAVLIIAAALILIRHRPSPPVSKQTTAAATNEPASAPVSTVESNNSTPKPTPASRVFPFVTNVPAGQALTNAAGWLEFPQLIEPPFAVRCEATLNDLAEFHLHYAIGQIVFNWPNHLKDLFMVSPQAALSDVVPDQGILLPGARREILWIVQSNSMAIKVDGMTRFQTNDDFSGLEGRVSVENFTGPVDLTAFEVQTPHDPRQSNIPPSEHQVVVDDILPMMVRETNLTEHFGPEGAILRSSVDWRYGLMSPQSFHPPFTIRTRAKTDAFNLRLFCEHGMIIFNWELNSRELRVHDPLNGAPTPVANQGFILPNEWHDIVWSIQPMGMTLQVDGRTRFQNHRDYRAVNGRVGIAPYKSELTVDYFAVEKK